MAAGRATVPQGLSADYLGTLLDALSNINIPDGGGWRYVGRA